MIYDGSIYSQQAYIIRPMNFAGHKSNLLAGIHTLKLMACVNIGGELHIPHLNLSGQEYLIQPPISGSLLIIGYNWLDYLKSNLIKHKMNFYLN